MHKLCGRRSGLRCRVVCARTSRELTCCGGQMIEPTSFRRVTTLGSFFPNFQPNTNISIFRTLWREKTPKGVGHVKISGKTYRYIARQNLLRLNGKSCKLNGVYSCVPRSLFRIKQCTSCVPACLGRFFTSAQNAAFETPAVKRFFFIIYTVAFQPHADIASQPRRFFYTCVWTARFSSLLGLKNEHSSDRMFCGASVVRGCTKK